MEWLINLIKGLLTKLFPSNTIEDDGPVIEPDDPTDDDTSKDPVYTPNVDQDKFKK